MTKLKISINLNTNCKLQVTDVTGFVSGTNTEGFILESTSTIPADSYKLSEGYLVNYIIYNKYNANPILTNISPNYDSYASEDITGTYASLMPAKNYDLTQDGVYTIERYFIISKETYEAFKFEDRFEGKTIVYYDAEEEKLFKVVAEVATEYELEDFISDRLPNFTGMVARYKVIATCNLNKCYYTMNASLIEDSLTNCKVDKQMKANRDILYMSLEVIKYLKELNNSSEIQRIIESLSTCEGMCGNIIKTITDCGCN